MIVATAGHIDHGKTLLVKTLTGVDTDRLPEEKARGISIDLGFAYLPLADDGLIGFVDVPGHERFIRNMLAGVCGINFALLVVAADDGIMPQTVEHLQILDLLHVRRGAAVITKTDRVDAARVREVQQNVTGLLAATGLAGAPVFPVSAITGSGMNTLRDHLVSQAGHPAGRESADQHFRFAVDRAFTVAGSGTVVTGTIFNGTVKTGDKLTVSPGGGLVRVRGIQIHGRVAAQARAGERCAINLAGENPGMARRGDWILAAEIHRPTQRIDARVKILTGSRALQHWTPVHLHLATGDVTARVATGRGVPLAAGESAIVQLVLEQPVCALRGDRFILRDQSAAHTLGGGFVLDPFGAAARRNSPHRLERLAALELNTPEQALAALLGPGGSPVDLGGFELTYNLTAERALRLYVQADVVPLGRNVRVGVTGSWHAALCERITRCVADFHASQPQAVGLDIETLRQSVAPGLPADAFNTVLRRLADERKVATTGTTVQRPGHDATANTADAKMWQQLQPVLDAAGLRAPLVRDLAATTKIREQVLKDFLYRKSRTGDVIRVGTERFYLRSTLALLAAIAQTTAQNQPGGRFTPAQYRDSTGIGRSLAMEILDSLDRLGITQRNGDIRKMRKDYVAVLGAPAAQPAHAPGSGGN